MLQSIWLYELVPVKSQEKWFKQIINASPVGMILVDSQGVVVLANGMIKSLFGYSPDELIGKSIEILVPSYYKEAHPIEVSNYFKNPKIRTMGIGLDINGLHKDGRNILIEIALNPVEIEGNTFALAVISDISQRLKLEEKKRLEALEEINKKLERSNQELQDFTRIASHDLKAPLRHIMTFIQILEEDHSGNLNDEAREHLSVIQRSGRRMGDLIGDLLKYAKTGTEELNIETVDLSEIVKNVLSDLEELVKEKNAQVNVDELPTIEATSTHMYQLFQNLLGNALKYSKKDVPPVVDVTCQISGDQEMHKNGDKDMVEISVKDNGIGFDEKYANRIFSPFHRLVGRNEYEGTGLGLATVKKIIDLFQGNIEAHSTVGVGSTFIVTLSLKHHKNGT